MIFPGRPLLGLLLGALVFAACRPTAPAPSSIPGATPTPALRAAFVAAWGGVPADSLFERPSGVAVDAGGNLYVADTRRDRVLKLAAGGARAAWSAGPDGTPLHAPAGLAVDRAGRIFVADSGNHRVVVFNAAGRPLAVWGMPGGAAGEFNAPTAVALDGAGNLYVADTKNHRVQKFSPAGEFLLSWGSYGSAAGEFNAPAGIAVDRAGGVYVADTWNHRVQKFDARGRFVLQWGVLGRGDGRFNTPTGIATDAGGRIYVISAALQPGVFRDPADYLRVQRIQVFSGSGTLLRVWGRGGNGPGQFDRAAALFVDRAGTVFVADTWNHRVQAFAASGRLLRQWGALPAGVFKFPAALAVAAPGGVYVSDGGNFRVVRLDRDGAVVAVWQFPEGTDVRDIAVDRRGVLHAAVIEGGVPLVRRLSPAGAVLGEIRGFASLTGVAVDATGYVYAGDWRRQEIRRFDQRGAPAGRWNVELPGDLTADPAGTLYAVVGRHRIVKFGPGGEVLASWSGAGSGDELPDAGIAVDRAGRVYLASPLFHRVEVLAPGGMLLGRWGTWGAAPGQFNQPRGIAVDGGNRVYVADPPLNRVQLFRVTGLPD